MADILADVICRVLKSLYCMLWVAYLLFTRIQVQMVLNIQKI